MTFASAIDNQLTETTNGMSALVTTKSACVDLFFKIGASRGKDIIPDFVAAYVEDKELALRIAQWARDARGGAGERQLFKDILLHLAAVDTDAARKLTNKIPVIGRWDDLLVLENHMLFDSAVELISKALNNGNGLAAKWMPRKGAVAAKLRKALNLRPKAYRKLLVSLSDTVEQKMCSNKWDEINFSHVPSVASARYRTAFDRHTPKYAEYVQALKNGDPEVKVNAGAVYPYQVLKNVLGGYTLDATELDFVTAQWDAMPNFVGDAKLLPMIDVSGSMFCKAGGPKSDSATTCMDVAVSLGLYLADKNVGPFKDIFCTFSGSPELKKVSGNIVQKVQQIKMSDWGMNTNIEVALIKLLKVAKQGNVAQADMPDALVILSDMQFDVAISSDRSAKAIDLVRDQYAQHGYKVPAVVFWNINAYDNVPVAFNEHGVALISGFSPEIIKAVLSADFDNLTPEAIMRKAVMVDRYDLQAVECRYFPALI